MPSLNPAQPPRGLRKRTRPILTHSTSTPHAVQPPPPNTPKYPGPAPQRAYAPYPVGVMYGAPPPPQSA
ncbi:hypothetical protein B0H14DRAFT_3517754 [Mycena olivaceomarginata]|nr:hypothetical protein B0H14DRAFT_3517754 [Mycena olivaceomarginata]